MEDVMKKAELTKEHIVSNIASKNPEVANQTINNSDVKVDAPAKKRGRPRKEAVASVHVTESEKVKEPRSKKEYGTLFNVLDPLMKISVLPRLKTNQKTINKLTEEIVSAVLAFDSSAHRSINKYQIKEVYGHIDHVGNERKMILFDAVCKFAGVAVLRVNRKEEEKTVRDFKFVGMKRDILFSIKAASSLWNKLIDVADQWEADYKKQEGKSPKVEQRYAFTKSVVERLAATLQEVTTVVKAKKQEKGENEGLFYGEEHFRYMKSFFREKQKKELEGRRGRRADFLDEILYGKETSSVVPIEATRRGRTPKEVIVTEQPQPLRRKAA